MNIPLNIDWQQILLHLFNFAILMGGLYFILYKPVKKFMAKREDYYKDLDCKAKSALEEAESFKAEYAAKLEQAEETIRNQKTEAQRAAAQAAQEQLDEAKAEADKIISNARVQAKKCKDKIVEDSGEEIKALAMKAAEKLIISSSSEAMDKFLDQTEEDQNNV